jgi:hypothetical protein
MRIAVTGATGLIGSRLVGVLRARGDEVTVLSRDPERARARLEQVTAASGSAGSGAAVPANAAASGTLQACAWDPLREAAPVAALEGRDAVVHLAGENIAQRWSAQAKRAIRESRVRGTQNLLAGIQALPAAPAGGRPSALVSSSAIGYYGARGEEPIDEEAPAGSDFLAQICREWEQQAAAAADLGLREVRVRTGVVLDREGGALAKMLPPFRLGIGGPVAGGRQYVSWVHPDDLVGIFCAALADPRWSGAVNATAPEPVTNRELSAALGRALHRPALLPVPGFALQVLYGEMAQVVTTGARVLPARPLVLGYEFRYPGVDAALAAALA